MWNLKNKVNKLIDTKNKLMIANGRWSPMAEGLGERVKKVNELRSTNWQLQNSHRDVKYSTGNMVNNIVITMCGARWVLDLSEGIT